MIDPSTMRQIQKLLLEKYGVKLPPDLTPATFERDLLCALHGHPGYEIDPNLIAEGQLDDDGDMGEYEGDDEDDEDEEEAGTGQLSYARRPAHRPISAARAKQVAAEFCKNTGLV